MNDVPLQSFQFLYGSTIQDGHQHRSTEQKLNIGKVISKPISLTQLNY